MRESEGESEGRKEREVTQAQRTEEGKEVRTHLALHLGGVRECEGERGRERGKEGEGGDPGAEDGGEGGKNTSRAPFGGSVRVPGRARERGCEEM